MRGNVIPLHRTPDMMGSLVASAAIRPKLSDLQTRVLAAICAAAKPITALELEEQYEFLPLAPSTVRKRVSELKALNIIIGVGMLEYTDAMGRTSRAEGWTLNPVPHLNG